MGCSSSRLDNQEAVKPYKIRKRLAKVAVVQRHAFASAHASYIASLKDTGSALQQFADAAEGSTEDAKSPVPLYQPPLPPPLPPEEVSKTSPPQAHKPLPRAVSLPPFALRTPEQTSHPRTLTEDDENYGYLDEDSRHSAPSLDDMTNHIFDTRVSASGISDLDEAELDSYAKAHETDNEERVDLKEEPYRDSMSRDKPKSKETPQEKESRRQSQMPPPQKGAHGSKKDLQSILSIIDENFLKSHHAGKHVSHMLEAQRVYYHPSIADSKSRLIDYQEKVSKILKLSKSVTNASASKDTATDPDKKLNLALTLDNLRAWEKKLYEEIKAFETTRLDLARRHAQLKSQKERGIAQATLEKTRAAVKTLEARSAIERQAVDSAMEEVRLLQDENLYPQLLELVDKLDKMWKKMFECHQNQHAQAAGLIGMKLTSGSSKTNQFHGQITDDLKKEIDAWRANLERMVTTQHDWVNALFEWLNRNKRQLDTEAASENPASPLQAEPPLAYLLCQAWVDAIKDISSDAAVKALANFSEILGSMMAKLTEEDNVKKRVEDAENEWKRKKKKLESYEAKYKEKHGDAHHQQPENEELISRNPLQERKNLVDVLERGMEDLKETHARLCKENGSRILVSLKEGLPPVMQAMMDFSNICVVAYKKLHKTVVELKDQEMVENYTS